MKANLKPYTRYMDAAVKILDRLRDGQELPITKVFGSNLSSNRLIVIMFEQGLIKERKEYISKTKYIRYVSITPKGVEFHRLLN